MKYSVLTYHEIILKAIVFLGASLLLASDYLLRPWIRIGSISKASD